MSPKFKVSDKLISEAGVVFTIKALTQDWGKQFYVPEWENEDMNIGRDEELACWLIDKHYRKCTKLDKVLK